MITTKITIKSEPMNFEFSIRQFKVKIIITAFLLLILFALCNYYNDNYEANAEYPSTSNILSNYPAGEVIYVSGNVIRAYEGGFCLKDTFHGVDVVYKVNSSSKVNIKDCISVLGTLGPSYNIKASKILVAKRWKEDFLLLRSAIGCLILLFLFWRFWKFDINSMEFIKRK